MEKEFKFDVGDVVRLPGNHIGTTAGEVFIVEKRWHGMTGEDAYRLRSTMRKHVTIDANGYHMSKTELFRFGSTDAPPTTPGFHVAW